MFWSLHKIIYRPFEDRINLKRQSDLERSRTRPPSRQFPPPNYNRVPQDQSQQGEQTQQDPVPPQSPPDPDKDKEGDGKGIGTSIGLIDDDKRTGTSTNPVDNNDSVTPTSPESDPTNNPTQIEEDKLEKPPIEEVILAATKRSIVAGFSQAAHFTAQVAIDKVFDWWHQRDHFSGPVESRYTSFLIHPKIPTIPDFQPQHLHPFQPQVSTLDIVMQDMSQNSGIDADQVGSYQPPNPFGFDSPTPPQTTTPQPTTRTTHNYDFVLNDEEDAISPPAKRMRTERETEPPPMIIVEDGLPGPASAGTDDPMTLAEQQHFESIGMEGWQHTTRDSQSISVEIKRTNEQVIHIREQFQSTTFADDAESFCVTARGFSELAEVFNQNGHVEEASNLISIANGALEGVNLLATEISENPVGFAKDMAVTGGLGLAIGLCCPVGGTIFLATKTISELFAGSQIYNQLLALPPDQRVEGFTKIIVYDSIKSLCLRNGLRVTSKISRIAQDIVGSIIKNKPLAKSLVRGVKSHLDLCKRYPQEVAQRALNLLKQNPSLVEESRDLGKTAAKVAAKVAEKVATEGKRTVGITPKPSAPHTPHTKTPPKLSHTNPRITKPRKPPTSRGKRPLDTACEKTDSLVPSAAQKPPKPSASAPKKPKLQTQPVPRAPPAAQGCQVAKEAGEIPKRVTRSAARTADKIVDGEIKKGSNLAGQTKQELLKSKSSFEKLIQEHKKKLYDYKQNPEAHDNKGLLKNVSERIRQKRINGRISALEKQIRKQRYNLDEINRLLK